MIYLDNAATTKIHPDVLDAMMPYLTTEYGNAGTKYQLGIRAFNAVTNARNQVADFIKASQDQIIFTSSGSEANNYVFKGIENYLSSSGKTRILVSSVEHDSVLRSSESMKDVFSIGHIGVLSNGKVNISELEKQLQKNSDIGLVSVMYENNETGAVNPIGYIRDICKAHNVLFHTDCVQAAGWLPIDVREIQCDFLSLSSHKIHGPKGVGALYAKDKKKLSPIILGGSRQEFGYRGGTENVAGIVGFGKACDIFTNIADEEMARHKNIKWVFYDTLKKSLCENNLGDIVHINAEPVDESSKTLSLRFDGIDSETLLLLLDAYGICVSAGSACKSQESKPSRVLTEIISEEDARNSIRVSFSILNTEEEVVEAANTMAGCVGLLAHDIV